MNPNIILSNTSLSNNQPHLCFSINKSKYETKLVGHLEANSSETELYQFSASCLQEVPVLEVILQKVTYRLINWSACNYLQDKFIKLNV